MTDEPKEHWFTPENPGDYLKEVEIQATPDAPWQHIAEMSSAGERSWWRDGIRVQPFDFDREHSKAYRASDFSVREGGPVVYAPTRHESEETADRDEHLAELGRTRVRF